jgi:hypothetical protein
MTLFTFSVLSELFDPSELGMSELAAAGAVQFSKGQT